MKLARKIITFRKLLNQMFRVPFRTKFTRLSNGLVTEIQVFKNKQIVEVKVNIDNRFLNSI